MLYSKEVRKELIRLADNIAANAAAISNHGYDSFIQARDQFIEVVEKLSFKEDNKN